MLETANGGLSGFHGAGTEVIIAEPVEFLLLCVAARWHALLKPK